MGFSTPEQDSKFKMPVAHTRLIKVESPPPRGGGASGHSTVYFVLLTKIGNCIAAFLFSNLGRNVVLSVDTFVIVLHLERNRSEDQATVREIGCSLLWK